MQNMFREKAAKLLLAVILRTRIHRMLPKNKYYLGMILMFHRVLGDARAGCQLKRMKRLEVTRRRLEQVIVFFMNRGYQFLSLDDAYNVIMSGKTDKRFVCLTFDDGYKDTYEVAFPLLRKHRIPFAMYVATAIPEFSYVFWVFMLDDLIGNRGCISFEHDDCSYYFDTNTRTKKENAYLAIEKLINSTNSSRRAVLFREIFGRYGYDIGKFTRELAITWEQIREMSRDSLVTVGAHTVNHLDLSTLSDDEVVDEILMGKQMLEAHIERAVEHFAYPFGCMPAVSQREFSLTKALEFKTCATTRHGYLCAEHQKYLERLPRILVDESSEIEQIDILFRGPIDRLRGRTVHFTNK
jgi:peptidoglycan/xylan/chitin deacetylase (PgdA/CDA1 family)